MRKSTAEPRSVLESRSSRERSDRTPAAAAPELFVGYADSFHDGAIVLSYGGELYAEGLERHVQAKRSILHLATMAMRWAPCCFISMADVGSRGN